MQPTFFEEFVAPHYQPILTSAGKLDYVEVLMRFLNQRDPQAHTDAIRVAEKVGFIYDLDLAMLTYALHAGRAQRVPIGVNLSPVTIERAYDLYLEMLDRNRSFLGWVTLEITETAATENMAHVAAFCREVRGRGVTIALDDFGASAGSFEHRDVESLRPDIVKIAAERVADTVAQDGQRWLRGVVALARRVGARVIAEGVETRAMALHVLSMGCDSIQGYVHGKPTAHLRRPRELGASTYGRMR